MHCVCIIWRNDSGTYVHCEVVSYLEIMHICKDVRIYDLKQVECCCRYDRIVSVSSIYVSVVFCRLGIDRTVIVGQRCLAVDTLESFVVGVVVSQELDRTHKTTPIDRNLEQFSIVDQT
jgi:hypothetical protein